MPDLGGNVEKKDTELEKKKAGDKFFKPESSSVSTPKKSITRAKKLRKLQKMKEKKRKCV